VGETAGHTTADEERDVDDVEKEEVGKIAGLGTGLFAGAKVGSAVFPVPVIGTFAGAVIGAVVGSELGRTTGKAVINGATAFVDTFRAPTPATVEAD
jgi:outer membrane lipoprotein SlyB